MSKSAEDYRPLVPALAPVLAQALAIGWGESDAKPTKRMVAALTLELAAARMEIEVVSKLLHEACTAITSLGCALQTEELAKNGHAVRPC